MLFNLSILFWVTKITKILEREAPTITIFLGNGFYKWLFILLFFKAGYVLF